MSFILLKLHPCRAYVRLLTFFDEFFLPLLHFFQSFLQPHHLATGDFKLGFQVTQLLRVFRRRQRLLQSFDLRVPPTQLAQRLIDKHLNHGQHWTVANDTHLFLGQQSKAVRSGERHPWRHYLRQGGNVFARLCLFVCVSARELKKLWTDLSEILRVCREWQTTSDSILGLMRKESWILDHFEIFVTVAFNTA